MIKWLLVMVCGLVIGGGVSLGILQLMERGEVNIQEEAEENQVVEVPPAAETKIVTLAAVGDVMLGRSVNTRMIKYESVDWPFDEVRQVLQEADLALGNLENPLIEGCLPTDEGMIFCGRSESVAGLVRAGFDGMSLANNHSLNYGTEGLVNTEAVMEESGIMPIGNEKVGRYEIDGVRIGVLAYDDVTRSLDLAKLEDEIRLLQGEAEVVIVLVHWGVEYVAEPTDRQQELGRGMIDAGADVVVGSHPHWTQPVEKYREGLIFYSLGNFVFDQMWSEATRLGEIAEIRFKIQDSRINEVEYELLPVRIYEYGQPRIIDSRSVDNR